MTSVLVSIRKAADVVLRTWFISKETIIWGIHNHPLHSRLGRHLGLAQQCP
jgi:hypothetical protein